MSELLSFQEFSDNEYDSIHILKKWGQQTISLVTVTKQETQLLYVVAQ